MKLANLEIFFDKEFYRPEDEVLAKILLTVKKDIHLNSFTAKIWGIQYYITVPIIDTYNFKTPGYESEILFEEEQTFLRNEGIDAGEHEFYISHTIPRMNLKEMKKSGYDVKFFVSAHADIPMAIDLDVKSRILVLSGYKDFEELKKKVDEEEFL